MIKKKLIIPKLKLSVHSQNLPPCQQCYYRFCVNDDSSIELKTSNEKYNTNPFVVQFNSINAIGNSKAVIEKKFNVNISYLRPKDASFLINWCSDRNFIIKRHINEEEKQYTKLFMCSEFMKFHYNYYSDVVIIDLTYRVKSSFCYFYWFHS